MNRISAVAGPQICPCPEEIIAKVKGGKEKLTVDEESGLPYDLLQNPKLVKISFETASSRGIDYFSLRRSGTLRRGPLGAPRPDLRPGGGRGVSSGQAPENFPRFYFPYPH